MLIHSLPVIWQIWRLLGWGLLRAQKMPELRRRGETSFLERNRFSPPKLIAPAMFILLARKPARLPHGRALSSWLFETTRASACSSQNAGRSRQLPSEKAHQPERIDLKMMVGVKSSTRRMRTASFLLSP